MSYSQVPTKLKCQDSHSGLQAFLISSSTTHSASDSCVCLCHLGFQSHLKAAALTLFTSNALPQGLYKLPFFPHLDLSTHLTSSEAFPDHPI